MEAVFCLLARWLPQVGRWNAYRSPATNILKDTLATTTITTRTTTIKRKDMHRGHPEWKVSDACYVVTAASHHYPRRESMAPHCTPGACQDGEGSVKSSDLVT
ncbi:hypothetical protein E2C01_036048 [Portunus trituberculatus]|uniref:Uncharacterized protein n=1 Tax=Portunus trituberculatus TaxID=210409 RepID=A0A5B7FAT5_PORTR|nr:hypothetical protein [Portunus trituberculatus]